MATLTPVNGDLISGMARQTSDTIVAQGPALISGDYPPLGPATDELVGSSNTIAAYAVVGRVGNLETGALALANTTTVKAIGVLPYAVATGAGVPTARAPVYRTGVFNPDALVWDASFSTDALKLRAFEGSPSPTQVIMRKIASATF